LYRVGLDENEEIGVEMSFCETWESAQEREKAGSKKEKKLTVWNMVEPGPSRTGNPL
jgi:hypothetical protein